MSDFPPLSSSARRDELNTRLENARLAHLVGVAEQQERRRIARESEPWYAPFKRGLRAASFFVVHAALAALIIGLLSMVNLLLVSFGGPKLFHTIPVEYIFDVMDLVTLTVFGVFGTIEAVRVFKD